MSSIVNSSNANSALIQTIESSDSMVNPSVYNVKEVNPTYSMSWVKNEPVNGQTTAGGVQNYNLQKYGIIQQILLTYQKQITIATAAATGGTIEAGDIYNTINKVELLSSSRVVSILTQSDLLSQFSNLQADEFAVVNRTCVGARVLAAGAVGAEEFHTFVIPLHFGFMESVDLNLNSSFLETLSIRVTYGNHIGNLSLTAGVGDAPTATTTIINPHLRILYKSLPEQPTAQMLAENFSTDSLVQVSSRFYDENAVYATSAAADPNYTMSCDLKNTDCVEAYYVIIRPASRTPAALNYNAGHGTPVQIKKLSFTASGQQILELDELELPYTKIKENGWSTSIGVSAATDDASGGFYVMKIQSGLYDYGGGMRLSNTQSLRELNAPRLTATFNAAAGVQYRMDVVENTTAVYQIASNTGRLSLALSN